MDPITQGVLGAAWAEPAARRSRMIHAALVGCIAGMAPDLDILIRSDNDPLLALEYHRHFTHALAFIPFGALFAALILYPFVRKALSFGACYGFSVLGYASHGLLDACTSYGTMLLWPFSTERIAWDLVSVIDPFFSAPLLLLVVLALVRNRIRYALLGTAWCLFYLGLGLVQNQRARHAIEELSAARGHQPERVTARPSFANILLWRTIYHYDGAIYIDAVRVGASATVFEGASRPALEPDRDFPWLGSSSLQRSDIDRFDWFADGNLSVDPEQPDRIVDLRYSLVPNSPDAFWGIELDPDAAADQHARYVTMRSRSMAEGRELLRMLF